MADEERPVGTPTVRLRGEVDASNVAPVREELATLLADGDVRSVVFDLSDATFLDSSVLAVFATAVREGRTVSVRGASAIVRRAIEVTGLDLVLTFENREERRFAGDVSSVQAARSFVVDALSEEPVELRDAAVLLVSEVATNAVRHGGTAYAVEVEMGDDVVRISVEDHGGGTPRVARRDVLASSGRGLQIVGSLADRWGTEGDGDRTTVWFELARSPRPSAGSGSPASPSPS